MAASITTLVSKRTRTGKKDGIKRRNGPRRLAKPHERK
jgi:hypothetical protein